MSISFAPLWRRPTTGAGLGTAPLRGRELKFPSAKPRSWRVLHAAEYARDVLPVVEGQATAGMRPFLVTPLGACTPEMYLARQDSGQRRALSLLRLWQDVRGWRKALVEYDPENSADIVHCHSFASGMAAARSFSCVAYDPAGCIEELAVAAGQCEPGSWIGRSFRTAEQFILSRAEAVIVHSHGMREAMLERGAAPEDIFVIPEPMDPEPRIFSARNFLADHFAIGTGTLACFVPQFADGLGKDLSE